MTLFDALFIAGRALTLGEAVSIVLLSLILMALRRRRR